MNMKHTVTRIQPPVPLVQGGTPLPGIEPGTRRLTAVCSTAELKRNGGSEPTANFGEMSTHGFVVCVGGEIKSYSQLESHTDCRLL